MAFKFEMDNQRCGGGGGGAPTVWVDPSWAEYPVMENFYGKANGNSDSPYDMVFSPTNKYENATTIGATSRQRRRTLGCSYHDEEDFPSNNQTTSKWQELHRNAIFNYHQSKSSPQGAECKMSNQDSNYVLQRMKDLSIKPRTIATHQKMYEMNGNRSHFHGSDNPQSGFASSPAGIFSQKVSDSLHKELKMLCLTSYSITARKLFARC